MGHPTFILRLFALLSALLVTLCGCLVQPTGGTFDNLSMGNWGNGESYSGPACGPGQECPRPGPSQAEFVPGYTCPTEDGELSSPRAYLHKYTLNSSSFYRLRGDECSDPEETEVVDASEIFGNGYRLLAYRGRIFYEHGGSWEPLSEPEPGDFPFGPPTGRYVEVWCHLSRSTLEGIGLMILDDGTAIVAETRTVGGEWKRRFSQKLPVSRTEVGNWSVFELTGNGMLRMRVNLNAPGDGPMPYPGSLVVDIDGERIEGDVGCAELGGVDGP